MSPFYIYRAWGTPKKVSPGTYQGTFLVTCLHFVWEVAWLSCSTNKILAFRNIVYKTILLLGILLFCIHTVLQSSFIIHASDKTHCKFITLPKGNQTYCPVIQVFKSNFLAVLMSMLVALVLFKLQMNSK